VVAAEQLAGFGLLRKMIIANGKDGLPTPRRYFAITTITLAVLLSSFSTSVVNVALPTIARDIGSTEGSTAGFAEWPASATDHRAGSNKKMRLPDVE
jgi:hypothetical protein